MNKKKEPAVFIIVLNWNNAPDTVECLQSLNHVEYKNIRVVVVDNGSSDDSLKKIRKTCEESVPFEVDILENSDNLGYAGGNNAGIRHSLDNGADYVLILNNDTSVKPSFLNKLVAHAEKDEGIGALGPAIYFWDKPDLIWFGGRTRINWILMEHAISSELYRKNLPQEIEPMDVSFLTGACILLKREALEEVKGFDERFFLYFEDADLSFRMKKKKWRLLWVPQAGILHKVSATALPKTGASKMNYYNVRNILLLAKKHGPWWVRGIYMHFWAYYKFTKQIIKFAFPNKYNKDLSLLILQGIRDYYRGNFGKYEE